MYFKTSFMAAAAAVGSALAHDVKTSTSVTASTYLGGLNLYWGQYGLPDDRLSAYCDAPGVTSVSLSFVTYSPKFGGGVPGTNFAGHCGGEVFFKNPLTGLSTKLIMNCDFIKQDIKYCQNKGIKVLLSVGGQCDTSLTGGNGCPYDVDNDQQGEEFGELLHKMFGPYDASWTGARPFDISATEHNAVDGFDIDLEFKYTNFSPYIKMVEKLRSSANYYISAAPQCPTADQWFQMKALIYAVKFDALFIQFFNNPGCQISDTPNYDDWEVVLSQTSLSKDAKLYIGVLASPAAGWAGYVSPSTVKDLICKVKSKAHFGGVSVWDATRGGLNLIGGQAFHVAIADALKYGCDAIPSINASISGSVSASASAAVTVSASAAASVSASASVAGSVSGSVSGPVSGSASVAASASLSGSGSASLSGNAPSASATIIISSASASASGFISASVSVPGRFSNATVVNSASASATDVCEEDDDGFPSATPTKIATASAASGSVTGAATGSSPNGSNGAASVSGTGTLTVTPFLTGSVSASVTGSGSGASASGSVVASAPSGSDAAKGTDAPVPSPGGSDSNFASGTAKPVATGPLSVTGFISGQATGSASVSGQASATGSGSGSGGSASGSAAAGTDLPLPTPVGPDSGNPGSGAAKPVVTGSVSPGPATDAAQNTAAASQAMTVSTVFTTSVYTVTSCAPTVTNCPVGQVTTKVVPWYTTVCPVAEATPGPSEPSKKVSTPGDVSQPPKVTGGNSPESNPGQGGNKVVGQPSGSPMANGDVPKPTGPTGGQVVAQPSGSAPKVNGDVPQATGPNGGQGGSQPSGGAASPMPTTTPVGTSGKCTGANCSNNGGNNGMDLTTTLRTTLTIPVTAVAKSNSTIAATLPGTGSPSKPTSGTPVPSQPVQAGAGKVGAVGLAGFAAVAAAFLL
ncbi:putative endochitinase [Colletotrichum karsti]|uniref:Endochitinase n=1 Tax=Colletotrichum karsti TaxID=1095194 RepID=A0A9P6ICQ7_9PEZI|nr:putative endochitinase [Colletotrichum karsti]KAF9879431.1 putative endochitinase [Colletotrichum karsti]